MVTRVTLNHLFQVRVLDPLLDKPLPDNELRQGFFYGMVIKWLACNACETSEHRIATFSTSLAKGAASAVISLGLAKDFYVGRRNAMSVHTFAKPSKPNSVNRGGSMSSVFKLIIVSFFVAFGGCGGG